MNLLYIARTVIKRTLENSAEYRALLEWPDAPGVYRTFGEYVAASVPPPYVTIEWYAGGLSNAAQTQDSDSLWKVCIHTIEDEPLAMAGANAIYNALHNVWPDMGNITGFAGYHPIELKYPFQDATNRQGRILLRAGGIYSLRLAEKQG